MKRIVMHAWQENTLPNLFFPESTRNIFGEHKTLKLSIMFGTIFTVTKIVGESREYSAYFENYFDAFVFAKKEVSKIKKWKGCDFTKRGYLDGSFQLEWDLENIQFFMNDSAWITDFRFKGIGFYDESGLLIDDFCSMETLRAYFKRSRLIALS